MIKTSGRRPVRYGAHRAADVSIYKKRLPTYPNAPSTMRAASIHVSTTRPSRKISRGVSLRVELYTNATTMQMMRPITYWMGSSFV